MVAFYIALSYLRTSILSVFYAPITHPNAIISDDVDSDVILVDDTATIKKRTIQLENLPAFLFDASLGKILKLLQSIIFISRLLEFLFILLNMFYLQFDFIEVV